MRPFTRLLAIGTLLISCSDSITGIDGPNGGGYTPPPCGDPGRVVLTPTSLHLVMGAADRVWLDLGCDSGVPAGTSVNWTVLDPAVASIHTDPSNSNPSQMGTRTIQAQAPGRTFVVATVAGRQDSVPVFVPDTASLGPIARLGAGGSTSCAVTEDGDAWCWGYGGPLLSFASDPAVGTCMGVRCSPVPVLKNTGVQRVFTGGEHACTLDQFGEAACWGDNQLGRVGISAQGGNVYNPTPVSVDFTFRDLALGGVHTCGLDGDGKAYCWGSSAAGMMGNNLREEYASPTAPGPVSGNHTFVSLAAGPNQTCGATEEGDVYCWGILGGSSYVVEGAERCPAGSGKDGTQLYVGCSYVPLKMPVAEWASGDNRFVQVSGGCARTVSGSVFCFDSNTGRYTSKAGLSAITDISVSTQHGCGLTDAGSALCWGANDQGQLGDGTQTDSGVPVSVSGDHTFTQISVGESHSCGVTLEKEVWCWGASHYGAAGRSILSPALVPEKVRGQGGS